jgi:hypothetical protein
VSFTIKLRGSPPRLAIADYECPTHGRFEAQVDRDEHGDPPTTVRCQHIIGTITSIVHGPCDVLCNLAAEFRISAPLTRVRRVEAIKGKWEKPERKEWLDVSNLAEGQPLYEFREDRERIREEERKREVYEFARAHNESVIGIDD